MVGLRYVFCVLLCVMMAAGCATLQAPATPSKQWQAPESEIKLQKTDPVWISIRAQKQEYDQPLSMGELVDMSLANNPSTKQSWQKAKQAQAQQTVAQSTLYPSITVTGSDKRGVINANTDDNSVNSSEFSAGGTLSYLALDFGGRYASIRQAYELLVAANYNFNQSFQDLLRDSQKAYYTLYSAESDWQAKRADLETARTALNVTKAKLEAGLVSKLDVYQAKSNFYEASYNLESAKVAAKTSKGALAGILGLSADTVFEIQPPSKEVPVGITRHDVTKLINQALERRPDIASQRAQVRAKESAVRVADSRLWPQVNLKSAGLKDWYRYYGSSKRWGNDATYYGQVTATWDVFDGYANLGKKIAAEADLEAQRQALTQVELAATQDVWNRFHQFKSAIRQNRFSHASLTASDASFSLALEGYKAGLKNILDLLQAQGDLSTARSNLIQSQKDLYIARAELIHAIGVMGTGADQWTTEVKKI